MTDSIATHLDCRGHSSATLFEAGRKVAPAAVIALDPSIAPAWSGARVAGAAFTVQGAGGDNLALHRAVAVAPPGSVLVVDAGSARFGHWGEILAVAAQQRNITGLVIDGGIRDTEELKMLGFPAFSRNNSIRGTRKLFVGAFGLQIEVGGATVNTGELVVGDADGVVAIAPDRLAEVLDEADRRVADERRIVEALHGGASTLELYGLES